VSDETSRVFHWSTSAANPADRIGYWEEALSSAYVPLSVDSVDAEGFVSEFRGTSLGRITVVSHSGSLHRCSRGQRELALSRDRSFALVLLLTGSWNVTHCGEYGLRPGDLWLHDSGYPIDLSVCTSYTSANLQLPEAFLSEWLPNPAALVGRPISRNSKWGRILASYVALLSPDFVIQAPLPASVLTDQVGVLLALTSMELLGAGSPKRSTSASLRNRIHELVKVRCQEPLISAGDLARELDISVRTLHRVLATAGETFGHLLLRAKLDVGLRMLESPLFKRTTVAEIGRRAGFSDASHFTRMVRQRTGQTPLQWRRSRHA
jgi:AraC family transcriptional activator of tynA and feaB